MSDMDAFIAIVRIVARQLDRDALALVGDEEGRTPRRSVSPVSGETIVSGISFSMTAIVISP